MHTTGNIGDFSMGALHQLALVLPIQPLFESTCVSFGIGVAHLCNPEKTEPKVATHQFGFAFGNIRNGAFKLFLF
tara:strand:- start:234 stop:458 length:225 start_codon:yes stop_codon:yes gene_type:complete